MQPLTVQKVRSYLKDVKHELLLQRDVQVLTHLLKDCLILVKTASANPVLEDVSEKKILHLESSSSKSTSTRNVIFFMIFKIKVSIALPAVTSSVRLRSMSLESFRVEQMSNGTDDL